MTELSFEEINSVSGANALDTTTGSFVPAQSYSDCVSANAFDPVLTSFGGGGVVAAYCTIQMLF